MAKISKYVKLDKDILLEYIYNDGNLIGEQYKILIDSRDKKQSYVAGDTSGTGNISSNQLFKLDGISGKYGKVNTDYYSYLQYKEYSAGIPLRHDTLKFHIPINWTFGEHLGFYIKVYTFDSNNQVTYDLSNFYFDMTDVNQQNLLNFSTPPLLFQEKLWGKSISVEIPAVSEISTQKTGNLPKANSINSNLTNGLGLSLTTPIFIDFYFVDSIQTINSVTSYVLGNKVTTTIPQTPEFERLGLVVEHSINGDFFEIFGTYNDNIAEFNKFINDAVSLGNRYYVQYNITTYEQNIRGKTTTFTATDNFNETIEYRPIIKYSSTTAIIDVEMRLIDSVDDSYIIRRASYGMLQDELSKYSANMTKINLSNAMKPKIYNIKNNIDASLLGKTNSMGKSVKLGRSFNGTGFKVGIATNKGITANVAVVPNNASNTSSTDTIIETIKVPYPVLIDKFNIIGKSENSVFNTNVFFGNSKMKITIYPFDNIVKFIIASGTSDQPNYLDMTGLGDIKLVFKNDSTMVDFPLLNESGEVDLKIGHVVFKVSQSKFLMIKSIQQSGINLFYITANSNGNTSVVYTGLFQIFDTITNVSDLNKQSNNKPLINIDPKLPKETATVTRKLINSKTQPIKKGTKGL